MELSITEFRRNLFSVVQKAIDGADVWITHKGRRFRIVPESAPSKLSRITPMDIVAPGVDLADDSWKQKQMGEWEQKWDRRINSVSSSPHNASPRRRVHKPKTRRKA